MLLEGRGLTFSYPKYQEIFKNFDISLTTRERLGIVAPSGYGKSTLAKILAGHEAALRGEVLINSKKCYGYNVVQLIHQHPEKAVNPRWKMLKVLEEQGSIDYELVKALGIEKQWLSRYPNELSGGQLQRFCIARAMGVRTRFIIADEITASFDVITQAQIWQLILKEVDKRDIGLLIITHNKALASKICTKVINLVDISLPTHNISLSQPLSFNGA